MITTRSQSFKDILRQKNIQKQLINQKLYKTMKNYCKRIVLLFIKNNLKSVLIMKFLLLLTVLTTINVSASLYSQEARLNLSVEGKTLKETLRIIEGQSNFRFFYSDDFQDLNKVVTIMARNQKIDEIMSSILSLSTVTYKILENNVIVLTPVSNPLLNQPYIITGRITDASTGEPIPGANIVIEGTTRGTITDLNGSYSIEVPSQDAVLVFSFIGYLTQKVGLEGRTSIDINLAPDVLKLEEVVVTALGLEKSKRTLTYSTQQLDMDAITTIKEVNLGNALAGKVAGVSITTSSGAGGVAGDPRIIIRGDRSINGNNEPLIVVDGIPLSSSGSGLSGINPDDIESMNVLKGPAAAALYGSSANNGVIVLTTKKGRAGQAATLEINSVTTFDIPYLYPEFQNEYAQGMDGNFLPNVEIYSWGPKMTGQTVTDWTGEQTKLEPQPNNVKDFFKIGANAINTISYSTGVDKATAYFSYSNTSAKGVVPTNKMQRHNFNLRLTSEIAKNLNLDFKITYFNQFIEDNVDVGDDQFSVIHQLNRMPRSLRTEDLEKYYYYTEDFSLRQNVWAPDNTNVNNPYWSMYANETPSTINRVNTFALLKYDFTDWLYLQVRGGLNMSNSDSEEKSWWDTKYIWSGKGDYTTAFSKSKNFTADALLVFDKQLNNDFRLGMNAGTEVKDTYGRSMTSNAGGLSVENKFALNYGETVTTADYESRIQKQAVYGMAQLNFRNYLYLDATARNDWSSTLPRPYNYFYPSVGLTGIISDMVNLPEILSFVKIRASYAEVGNDANWANIFQTFNATASGPVGFLQPKTTKVPVNLIPEKTTSWEAGGEIRVLDHRLGLDFTIYKSNTYNQLILVSSPPSSGFSNGWINTGNIQNQGIELVFNARPIMTSDINWSMNLNFARNWNKVIELYETVKKYEISSPNLSQGNTWVYEGKPFGEVYTKGFIKNDAGQVVVDALGFPTIETDYLTYLGNMNYDWRASLNNLLTYKNWSMSFLIDLNYGSVRTSATEAQMLMAGTSAESLKGRESGLIVDGVKADGTPNDIEVLAQSYCHLVGGRISFGSGELFSHDATNSRLRELSIGYTVPMKSVTAIKGLQVYFVGRNLFYIYNGCKWFDPDNSYDISRNGQGAESAFLPGMRTLGVNIKLTL